MARSHDLEDWDLDPEGHLLRSGEILHRVPKSGEVISEELERMAIAARHTSLALLKFGEEAQALVREIRQARNQWFPVAAVESDPITSTPKEGPNGQS